MITTLLSALGFSQAVIPENYVSVVTYGATGDGTTDDRASIMSAISAAVSGGIPGVYFPTPSVAYQVGDSIDIEGISNLVLFGDGPTSYIRCKVYSSYPTTIPATGGVITIGDATASDNIGLIGLRIDAQGSSQPVDPADTDGEFNTVSLRECSYITIKDCVLEDGARDTLYLSGKASTASASDLHHIWIQDSVIEGSANRRAFSIVDSAENVFADNIFIDGNSNGVGLGFEPSTDKRRCNRIFMTDFVIDGGTSNITMTSTAEGNVPEDIVLTNFICKSSTGLGLNLGSFKRVTLQNFDILNSGSNAIETGTSSAKSEDLRMHNVRIYDPTTRGIWLRALNRGTLSDVHVYDAGSVGIHISSSSSTNFSQNINCTNVSTVDGASNGWLVDGYATRVFLANARIENNNSDGLMISYPESDDFIVEVRGGYVADNNGSGIRTNFPASFDGKVLISEFVSTNTSSGKTQNYGVELDSDADYVRLLGNDIRGNNTGSMVGNVGTNGVDSNNIK